MNWFSRIFNTNSIKGICRHSATYRGPVVTAATKKIQLTIIGATAGAGKVADITVLWRPVVAGGYYLNA